MSSLHYSPDFQHPDTRVPVCFVWDADEELLWLEPCESLCDEWNLTELEYEETEMLCKQWGEHTCASAAEANRMIAGRYPKLTGENVYFSED